MNQIWPIGTEIWFRMDGRRQNYIPMTLSGDNKLSLHTPTTPGVGQKVIFIFFSKSGHVVYQIKVEEV